MARRKVADFAPSGGRRALANSYRFGVAVSLWAIREHSMSLFEEPVSLDYAFNREAMRRATDEAIALSRQCAGQPSRDGQMFYGCLLFTSLCTRSFTLLRVSPETAQESREGFWDFSSVAGIARSILEVRLTFFYFVEPCSPEESACRIDIMNVHDCTSRIKLFTTMGQLERNSEAEVKTFKAQLSELHARLAVNPFFMDLSQGQRTSHLNGSKAYLYSLESIGARCGIQEDNFRLFYQLWSSQSHGLPLGFYRMATNGLGRGVHSSQEEMYTSMCLSLCYQLLQDASKNMRDLFKGWPPAKTIKPKSSLMASLIRRI
jgi:hypothetical protein